MKCDDDNNDGWRDDTTNRAFGVMVDDALPIWTNSTTSQLQPSSSDDKSKLLEGLRSSIIGSCERFTGPFGDRPMIYVDWTASGKSVSKIETYITEHVIPFYGNTHTTTSITGHQSTCFRHEARQIIAEAVNAKVTGRAAEDVVIFTGNGTTAAVNKLIVSLGLHIPLPTEYVDEISRPIVFTSSYEHHSNLISWRETAADVVSVQYSPITGVCLEDLARLLQLYASRKVKIGAFSAASNVTGIVTATNNVSALIHRAGGLVFYDYATAAPYVKIDMNPVCIGDDAPYVYKDAVFFSGHKFIGGPGCPGVLVVKRSVLPAQNSLPTVPGGGTVFYVTEEHHRYLSNREEREEGGTPNILGDVKLGLVVSMKQSFGAAWIEQEELRVAKYAQSRLSMDTRIVLLGRTGGWSVENGASNSTTINETINNHHLPIFSFLVRCGARFLHHNFVCALLNDLFGIQSRGGCQCAGPFSQQLLGLSLSSNKRLESALLDKHEVLRPGYSRLSLAYWMSQAEIDYVLDSVLYVAEHGFKFLPLYRYNYKTGEWAHTTRLTRFPERKWLSHFRVSAATVPSQRRDQLQSPLAQSLSNWGVACDVDLFRNMMQLAVDEAAKLDKISHSNKRNASTTGQGGHGGGAESQLSVFEDLRWFVLAQDLQRIDNDESERLAPLGPVQPSSGPRKSTEGSALVGDDEETLIETTADSLYAQKRSEKLCIRSGGEGSLLPRYLTIATVTIIASPKVSTQETRPVPSMKDHAVLKEIDPVASVPSSGSCSTGTCSFRQRDVVIPSSIIPPLIPTPLISTNGAKTQSGSGITYSSSSSGTGNTDASVKISSKPIVPPKKIMKLVGQAVKEWNMIEDGDRLLLGLSGGKDSLALLHILLALQKRAPVKFDIACATVDPQTDSFDPSPLIPYVQSLGITYHYLSEPIVALAKEKLQGDSLCAFCSRFKRGLLYSCCRTNGYNKLVLAQHLDDLAESFLMSTLHNGTIRTMKANYTITAGDVRVIRPLVYVREKSTRDFSQQSHLPVINENCPACFEEPKERDRIKKLLVQEEAMIPSLFFNLKRALIPFMADETYEVMNAVNVATDARGRNPMHKLLPAGKRPKSVHDGVGPGLFGTQSLLTNGKSRASDVINHDDDDDGNVCSSSNTSLMRRIAGEEMNDNEIDDDEIHTVKKAKYDTNPLS